MTWFVGESAPALGKAWPRAWLSLRRGRPPVARQCQGLVCTSPALRRARRLHGLGGAEGIATLGVVGPRARPQARLPAAKHCTRPDCPRQDRATTNPAGGAQVSSVRPPVAKHRREPGRPWQRRAVTFVRAGPCARRPRATRADDSTDPESPYQGAGGCFRQCVAHKLLARHPPAGPCLGPAARDGGEEADESRQCVLDGRGPFWGTVPSDAGRRERRYQATGGAGHVCVGLPFPWRRVVRQPAPRGKLWLTRVCPRDITGRGRHLSGRVGRVLRSAAHISLSSFVLVSGRLRPPPWRIQPLGPIQSIPWARAGASQRRAAARCGMYIRRWPP